MRSRATLAVVAVLVLATIAAAPLAKELINHDHRAHVHKDEVLRSSVVDGLDGRLSDLACTDGAAGPFACDGIDLLSFVPVTEMVTADTDVVTGCALDVALGRDAQPILDDPECLNPPGLSDIWGWTADDGDEYVIFGKTNGVSFYRVTDPTAPEYLGEISNVSGQLLWFDVKVYDHYAYIVSESAGFGIQVFDLERLEAMEAAATPYHPVPADARFMPEGLLDSSNHNIVIDVEAGRAYAVGGNTAILVDGTCLGGLFAFDLTEDPLEPPFLGCWDGSYIHDAHCATYHGPDTEHDGKQICVTSDEDSVSVVDVTDPTAMTQLSNAPYEYVEYAHQGWMSDDQAFYFHGDELDEVDNRKVARTRTVVFDIRDLDAIEVHFEHVHATASIDHNMYVRDGLLLQSNYTAGLRVLDTAGVADGSIGEIAYFDTFPDHDDAVFAGTWSNYPYFPSGTIAVSGIGEGLFLLRLQDHVVSASASGTAD